MSAAELADDIYRKDTSLPTREGSSDNPSARLVKLQNRIKHMEYNIDRNRNRGESLCRDCYSLFRSTELLAFDFVFASYLLGHLPPEEVYAFLDRCIRPQYDLSSGDPADFDRAKEHVKYLQSIITKCASEVFSGELKRPDIPKRTSEFVLHLKKQKGRLDQELARRRVQETEKVQAERVQLEEDQIEAEDLPASFSKWLTSELKVGMDQNEESIELRSLIASVARRLGAIAKLNESIKSMKTETLSLDELDYMDCMPEDLFKSPLFIGVKQSCAFLVNACNALNSQKELLPRCHDALCKVRDRLKEITESSEKAVAELQAHTDAMRKEIEQKKMEAEALKAELQPVLEAMNAKPELPVVPELPPKYAEVEARLKEELAAAQSAGDQAEKVQELEGQIKLIEECRQQRDELAKMCNERNELLLQAAEKDKTIFGVVLAQCKAEEDAKQQALELELLSKYEDSVRDVMSSIRLAEMEQWCNELGEIGSSFAEIADVQKKIMDELDKYAKVEDIEAKTAEKRKEIKALSEMNYRMCEAIGRAKLELEDMLDEQTRAQNTLELYSEWLPPYIDRDNEQQVEEYKKMVTCPVCKSNRRDCILATCGHAICRPCAEKSKGICPICKAQFGETDVKPFFLQ